MERLDKPRFIRPVYASNPEMDICYRLSGSIIGPVRVNMSRLRQNLATIRRLSLFKVSGRFMWKS